MVRNLFIPGCKQSFWPLGRCNFNVLTRKILALFAVPKNRKRQYATLFMTRGDEIVEVTAQWSLLWSHATELYLFLIL